MSAEPERLSVDLERYRLAHAPEISGSSSSSSQLDEVEKSSSSSPKVDAREPLDFAAALELVEAVAGERLAGWGRRLAEQSFEQRPEGFVRVTEKILRRADLRNPLAMFVRMLRDGDHLLDAPPSPSSSRSAPLTPLEQRMREKGEL